jgi:hypothetical protein
VLVLINHVQYSAWRAESVNVCPDGHLIMIDKYGAVRAAPKNPDSSTQLDPEPIAHLGPGRPLGFTFDAQGNLVVCDALKVGALLRHVDFGRGWWLDGVMWLGMGSV